MENEERLYELINKIKESEYYFHEFFELTKKQVFYNIYAILKDYQLSEDVLQETYVTFLQKIDTIDKHKSILGFLYKISRNKAIDYYRSLKRHADIDLVSNTKTTSYVHSYDSTNELLNKLKTILSDVEYQVVILHVINEMTNKEIAHLLKRPTNTIIWIYNKAIKKVKERLGDSYV